MLPPSPPRRHLGSAAFLPALAAFAALAVFAAHQRDPQAAAETAFLALLAAALLAAVAAVEAAPGAPMGEAAVGRGAVGAAAAVLAVLASWSLPAGPLRGAGVAALLVGALAVAAGRRLTAIPGGSAAAAAATPGGRGSGAARDGTGRQVLALLPLLVPLALAVQVLVRSDRLLTPEVGPRLLVGLLGLPLVAAAATAFLAARAGRAPALTAAATAALLGPGFTTMTAGALVALAGAEAAWRPAGRDAAAGRERLVGALALGAAVAGAGSVEPWAAAVVALAAALLAGRTVATGAVVLAAAAGAIALPAAGAWSGDLALATATVAPLALVVALAAASRGARRWALAAGGAALLAVFAARTGGGLPLLAAPLAAVPLAAGRSLRARGAGERHALFAPQVVWSAALLAAGVLAAAYPWLRPRPLAAALGLLGPADGWALASAAAIAAAAAVLGGRAGAALRGRRGHGRQDAAAPSAELGAVRLPRAGRSAVGTSRGLATLGTGPSSPPPADPGEVVGRYGAAAGPAVSPSAVAALAAAAVFAALVAALPSHRSVVLIAEPRSLDVANPRLEIELPAGSLPAWGELVVVADTSLSHAVAVPAATPVATMTLIGESLPGAAAPFLSSAGGWTLATGRDTAEWSIRRPDVAALAAHAAPEPWLARVAAEGFFGLVFRSRGRLAPNGARWLVIERHSALAPEAVVHLHRLEVRR